MEIASIRHKALRRLFESGCGKGLIEPIRLQRMLTYITIVKSLEEFNVPPNFGFHLMTGNRSGTYAMTVTKNWRLTFTLVDERTVGDLDLEDYH